MGYQKDFVVANVKKIIFNFKFGQMKIILFKVEVKILMKFGVKIVMNTLNVNQRQKI